MRPVWRQIFTQYRLFCCEFWTKNISSNFFISQFDEMELEWCTGILNLHKIFMQCSAITKNRSLWDNLEITKILYFEQKKNITMKYWFKRSFASFQSILMLFFFWNLILEFFWCAVGPSFQYLGYRSTLFAKTPTTDFY